LGPSAGYTLNSLITVLCVVTVSISMSYLHAVAFVSDIHIHIYVVTNLLMFYFWIKLTIKMPNYLTATIGALIGRRGVTYISLLQKFLLV